MKEILGVPSIFVYMIIGNSEIMNTWHEHLHLDLDPQNLVESYFILEAEKPLWHLKKNFKILGMEHFSFTIHGDLFLPSILPQTTWLMLISMTPKSHFSSFIPYGLIPSWHGLHHGMIPWLWLSLFFQYFSAKENVAKKIIEGKRNRSLRRVDG